MENKLNYKLEKLNINNIHLNIDNPRFERDKDIWELAQNIQRIGLLNPIIVRKEKENYILIDGERRFHAITALKWKKIDALIIDTSENDLIFQLSIFFNRMNIPIFPDKARAIYNLWKKTGLQYKQLAEILGKDESYIGRLIRIWEKVGINVPENKLTPMTVIVADIVSKFDGLTNIEKNRLAIDMNKMLKGNKVTVTYLRNNIQHFNQIPKEEHKDILKFGFQEAINQTKIFKEEKMIKQLDFLPYNKIYSRLIELSTHINQILDNIEDDIYIINKSQIFTVELLLKPLLLRLDEFINKEKKNE